MKWGFNDQILTNSESKAVKIEKWRVIKVVDAHRPCGGG